MRAKASIFIFLWWICDIMRVLIDELIDIFMAAIVIDIHSQTLTLTTSTYQKTYRISSAKNGTGQMQDSGCTPLGEHRIAQKIGEHAPKYSVFVGRKATGELYSDDLAAQYPDRDWILSRILWLEGLQEGFNRGKNDRGVCDTFARYIYIHGTPDSEPLGIPLSHGCIRMHTDDVVELFDQVAVNTPVLIV